MEKEKVDVGPTFCPERPRGLSVTRLGRTSTDARSRPAAGRALPSGCDRQVVAGFGQHRASTGHTWRELGRIRPHLGGPRLKLDPIGGPTSGRVGRDPAGSGRIWWGPGLI